MSMSRRPISNRSRCLHDGGFTLIELLIVVVIIGILAALAIPQFAVVKAKAGDATAKSDLRNLVTAEEKFFNDNQTYTDVLANLRGEGFTTSAHVTVTIQTFAGYYQADAQHDLSKNCYWVSYGINQNAQIRPVMNAAPGGGNCGG